MAHMMIGRHEDEQVAGKAFDPDLLRRLWQFVRPQRRLLLIGLALLLVSSACRIALPLLVKRAIDSHLTTGVLAGFGILALVYVAVATIEFVVRKNQLYIVDLAGQNALLDLRMFLFRHLQGLSARFFDKTPIGRLIGRVTTDIEALQEMFSSGVVTIFGDLVFLVATFSLLLHLNGELTAVTMMMVPVLLFITIFIRARVRRAYVTMRARFSRLNAYLHEHVSGMPLVQQFRREDLTRKAYRDINDELRDAQLTSVSWESVLSALMEMLGSFTTALILWYGGGIVIQAVNGTADPAAGLPLTLGTLFAFIDLMGRFFVPLNELSLKYTVMQNAMTASRRIFQLLDNDERIPEPEDPVPLTRVEGRIEFRNVTFGYDPDQPVLRDVSFSVAPGERVALVGATGAGKTSVLKLLTRLYDIQAGEILLDGIDIRRLTLADLRRWIAVVPQEGFLFEGDILENLRLGHPEIGPEKARAAAARLGLDEIVAKLPRGYHEPVAERGKNLSSGEKQLIAFARVLAVAPSVLVLDEATSHVDTHTEHLLQLAVHELMEGRSSLIVAHRLSTIRDVDRILVMHKGKLVEEGSHDELLERNGLYRRLYELQYAAQDERREGA